MEALDSILQRSIHDLDPKLLRFSSRLVFINSTPDHAYVVLTIEDI